MFSFLSRYLTQTIVLTTGMVLLLFLGIDSIFSFVNELKDVGHGFYSIWGACAYLLLTLPQKIVLFFPMAALIGSLMGLGLLASHSELLIMQVSGLSILRITRTVMMIALVLGVMVWILGEVIGPQLDRRAKNLKAIAVSEGQALRTAHGTWLRDGKDFVHIRKVFVGGHLEGVTRYQFDDNLQLSKSSYAAVGDFVNEAWILKDIQETHFLEGRIDKQLKDEEHWDSVLSPSILSVVGEKYLEKLSMKGLYQTIVYRKHNGLDSAALELAFFEKIAQPFRVAVMMLLAVPFIFGPLRSATMGLRLVAGILVGFVFYTMNEMIGHLTLVFQVQPIIGAFLPTALFMAFGVGLMKRLRM